MKLADDRTNRRLWTFFALTYGLSWIFWIPAAIFGQDFTTTAWGIPYLLGGFGPSAAGVIMTCRSRDRAERRDFWRRVVDFKRISLGWYLFIALLFPAVLATSFLLNALLGNPLPAFETLAQVAANPLTLLGMVIVGIITGSLSEELGWRGFALEPLQERWSLLVSSFIVAPFWWAWHLPLFFMEGTTQSSWGVRTPDFWLFLLAILPLSVLHAWVYDRNRRSILAAILLHFTYNFSLSLVYPISVTVKLLQAILLVVVANGMVLVDGSRRRSDSGVEKGQL